jgi:NAD(P)H dehydrogenase (quinone)
MKILVILAHPGIGSFNHAIANKAVRTLLANGHEVWFHDLYEEKFDPILPADEMLKGTTVDFSVDAHCVEAASADGIIIVHPNWWGQPPAILKGWVDRVMRPGVAYEFMEGDNGDGVPVGLLGAKAALVFNTSNTPMEREREAFGDPLETTWKNCVFGLCGVHVFFRRTFGVIATSTPEQRIGWLREVEDIVNQYFMK